MPVHLSANAESYQQKSVVMIVDDDFSTRLQVRFTLENRVLEVVEAADGQEALDLFRRDPPDLVLLDVIMADMDGFATCRELRRLPGGAHTPVVMVTGTEDPETITRAFDAGATDFISKPLNMQILGYRTNYWLRSGSTLNALKINQKRLFKAQEIARLGHWERDLDTDYFQLTCNSPEMFGLAHPCSYPDLFANIIAEDRDEVMRLINDACDQKQAFSVHYRVTLANGSERILLNQGEVVHGSTHQRKLAVGIIQDITELKQAEDKIRYLAFYDNLTGLANRALFREHWTKIKSQAQRKRSKLAILFIDLDHFKRINDTMGHPSGDKALIITAERLKSILRQSDIIARADNEQAASVISRVGGDEFTILAGDIAMPDHVARLAERIIESLCQPMQLNEQDVSLSASIGISVYPEDGEDIDTLLKNADTAMYEAKEKGRNNYQFFQRAMNDAAQKRFHLNNRLRRALDNGEFELYYQPQFANHSCKMIGVEALIRWIDPDRGLVPPNEFLPFAEENGFIFHINDWVIHEACAQAKRWVDMGLFEGRRMGVNISGNKINFKQLVTHISSVLSETGLDPSYLEIELTERVMMENTEEARRALLQLKEMGIAIAIDDFGTGYSALSHLQLFPLSTLKIDKSFIQNIASQDNSLNLLHSIINIAKCFKLKVVAEGVETEEQLSRLGSMECDYLQGFLLSKPAARDAMEAYMHSHVSRE